MEDPRIMYLKCVHEQRVANSAAATAAFTYVAVVGLTTERCTADSHEIKLWLTGVLVMSAFQVVVKIVQSKLALPGSGATRSDMLKLARCNETLDIISSCWFIVGHFLLLETYRRRHQYPFMYFLCWQYILSCYLSWTVHHLVEFSLHVIPPFSLEDRRYWHRLQAAVDGDLSSLPEYLRDGVKDEVRFWTHWLQSYGCYDVSLPPGASADIAAGPAGREDMERKLMQREDHCGDKPGTTLPKAIAMVTTKADQVDIEESAIPALVDSDAVCSICLCGLASPPGCGSSINHTEETPLTSSRPERVDQTETQGGASAEAADKATGPLEKGSDTDTAGPVVVRYPCASGRHYFHFDCLCGWMARASVRAVDIYGTPSLQPASCPCCRQPPCPELQELCGEGGKELP